MFRRRQIPSSRSKIIRTKIPLSARMRTILCSNSSSSCYLIRIRTKFRKVIKNNKNSKPRLRILGQARRKLRNCRVLSALTLSATVQISVPRSRLMQGHRLQIDDYRDLHRKIKTGQLNKITTNKRSQTCHNWLHSNPNSSSRMKMKKPIKSCNSFCRLIQKTWSGTSAGKILASHPISCPHLHHISALITI